MNVQIKNEEKIFQAKQVVSINSEPKQKEEIKVNKDKGDGFVSQKQNPEQERINKQSKKYKNSKLTDEQKKALLKERFIAYQFRKSLEEFDPKTGLNKFGQTKEEVEKEKKERRAALLELASGGDPASKARIIKNLGLDKYPDSDKHLYSIEDLIRANLGSLSIDELRGLKSMFPNLDISTYVSQKQNKAQEAGIGIDLADNKKADEVEQKRKEKVEVENAISSNKESIDIKKASLKYSSLVENSGLQKKPKISIQS